MPGHSGRFTIFQSCALRDVRLGNVHIMALAMLGQYTNRDGICWAKQDTMARQRGISQQAMSKALRLLVQCGYLKLVTFKDAASGATRNRYKILMDYELPERFDRSLDDEDIEGPSEFEMEEAGMGEAAQRQVVDPHNVRLSNAQRQVVHTNVPTTNVQNNNDSALDSAGGLTPRGRDSRSLAPLADAFKALGMKSPVFLPAEIGAAQNLLDLYEPATIALCWQEIATGVWGDQFARDNLSFRYLISNNRVANWERQKEGGSNGKANNGRTEQRHGRSTDYGERATAGTVYSEFVRPRVRPQSRDGATTGEEPTG